MAQTTTVILSFGARWQDRKFTSLSQLAWDAAAQVETFGDYSRRSARFERHSDTLRNVSGLTGGQVVAGSNPVSPTNRNRL
jgi:hypothetical protein